MNPERWQKIESIFNKALDADSGHRASVLEDSCAGDESLRLEVESLLAQHEKADGFIERPAFANSSDTPSPRPRSGDSDSVGILAGTVIGHYRIVGRIGSGGMGVVYEAEDLKLRRHVALKFLPEEVAGNPQALQRFRLEARAASALNHPNICTIYEVDEVDGRVFIAMELLEGQTLKQTVNQSTGGKPLPLETVIDFGVQIAGAINAAHSKGVVHRDIKPANIFVMKPHRIKVLDFGLAKLTRSQRNSDETEMTDGTEPGMVMGTVGYMSPEQVRGQAVDGRTDIFAFGAILYEMLAGRRAFERPTSSETMAAILNEDPPAISQLAPNTPPALARVVKRCLEKDPEQRFQSASDLAFALEALSESNGATVPAGGKRHLSKRIWGPAVLSAALIVVSLVLWKTVFRPQRAPRVLGFTKLTNDGQAKLGPMATDGTRIYFAEVMPGIRNVVVQVSVKGGDTAPLTVSVKQPSVLDLSRDGTDLLLANDEVNEAQYQSYSLWLQPVAGGSPRRVGTVLAGSAGLGASAAFGSDGASVIYAERHDVYSAALDGSSPRKVLTTENAPFAFRFSPNGKIFRFSQHNAEADTTTVLEAAADGTRFHKMFGGCCGEWTPDGRFFIFQDKLDVKSNLWALPDKKGLWKRNRDEKPTQLTAGPLDFEYPLPSKDGTEIFAIGTSPQAEVVRYDSRSGGFITFLPGVSAEDLAFSQDGQWVVYVSYPDGSLWRSRVDGSERLQLTFPPLQAELPRWSHDAKQIVFSAKLPDSAYNIYLISSEGGAPQRILPSEHGQMDVNWSPDGSSLIFASDGVPNEPISILDLGTKHVSTLPGSNGRFSPHWSPDGKYIAAITTDTQTLMLYEVATQRWAEIFGSLAGYETWSHDGRYIYFESLTAPDAFFRVLRLRLSDRKIEEIADMRKVGRMTAGGFDSWFGLAPDDSPLVTRDISTQEVYALEMDWP